MLAGWEFYSISKGLSYNRFTNFIFCALSNIIIYYNKLNYVQRIVYTRDWYSHVQWDRHRGSKKDLTGEREPKGLECYQAKLRDCPKFSIYQLKIKGGKCPG